MKKSIKSGEILRMQYEKPTITTYSEEELVAIIGPAQTYISNWHDELGFKK